MKSFHIPKHKSCNLQRITYSGFNISIQKSFELQSFCFHPCLANRHCVDVVGSAMESEYVGVEFEEPQLNSLTLSTSVHFFQDHTFFFVHFCIFAKFHSIFTVT